ncbi:MAG: DNA alkylation repair protein [Candidatus Shapirobacteria bacterium]
MNLNFLISDLKKQANPIKAKNCLWFFKTKKREYGYGDKFLGLTNPEIRSLVKKYQKLINLSEVISLLENPYHECRLTALLILVAQYSQGDNRTKKLIFNLYLSHTAFVNNWDLVDLSARDIIGKYCYEQQDCSILYGLSKSKDLWEKRISMIATSFYVKNNNFTPTINISKTLLKDNHDLIHKAVGWMLREVGKRDQKTLTNFLDKHALHMPRTALRYSIERLPESLRLYYLTLK